MRIAVFVVASTVALATIRSAMLAAPGQTQQPGQMTQARVWIQNRTRGEAIPINLEEVSLDAPLRVRVVNAQPDPGVNEPVNVRIVARPRAWQYQTITVARDDNIASALNGPGANGWEATGITFPVGDGIAVLMKRRQ